MSSNKRLGLVLRTIREAGRAISPAEVRKALQANGLTQAEADAAWRDVQKLVKAHKQVTVEGSRYRWAAPHPPDLSPVQALDLLQKDGLPGPARSALAAVIHGALITPTAPEENARRRQADIDQVRLVAELASEVEELLANETEPPVMMRQVRAWVRRSGLDPVGQAGEKTKFDRKKHQPIVGRIRDGAAVVVVRPGYIWKNGNEEVLLGKAVVEE